jgi:hypothetical protein
LKCIGVRDTGANGEQEVFYRWMHFLGGGDFCLGYFNSREEESNQDLAEVVWAGFVASLADFGENNPLVNCIPSFVTLGVTEEWVDFVRDRFFSAQAIQEANWGYEQYYLGKYGDRLFERAGEETREAYEGMLVAPDCQDEEAKQSLEMLYARHQHIPSFMAWEPNQCQSRGLEEQDFPAWWDTVTNPEFLGSCLYQWATAWAGATAQSGLEQKTRFEDVRDFLAHYQHPLWPSDFFPKL